MAAIGTNLPRLLKLFTLAILSGASAACASVEDVRSGSHIPADQPVQTAPAYQQPPAYTPPPPRARASIDPSLQSHIHEQWRLFPGKTGVAVLRIDGGGMVGKRLGDWFPQQSVSKTWVAMTVLEQIDQGRLRFDQNVRITPDDVAVFHQPLERRVTREGEVNLSIASLLELSITTSDNTANDNLLRVAGGPDAVRRFIARHNLGNIRFGPGERLLQAGIAGVTWRQKYSVGRRFYAARATVPYAQRKAALDRYLANPVDGASPQAIAYALGRLAKGELLSPSSTRLMLSLMRRVRSGPNRLKAGVPAGWGFAHKTGTGQRLAPVSTGYNDIGIMTAPDGTRYAVVVMMADTTASVPRRMRFMQSISRSVARHHRP